MKTVLQRILTARSGGRPPPHIPPPITMPVSSRARGRVGALCRLSGVGALGATALSPPLPYRPPNGGADRNAQGHAGGATARRHWPGGTRPGAALPPDARGRASTSCCGILARALQTPFFRRGRRGPACPSLRSVRKMAEPGSGLLAFLLRPVPPRPPRALFLACGSDLHACPPAPSSSSVRSVNYNA